jgi:hypothetical protein
VTGPVENQIAYMNRKDEAENKKRNKPKVDTKLLSSILKDSKARKQVMNCCQSSSYLSVRH